MNRRHQRILEKIFEKPVRSDVKWSDIESLLIALGAALSEESGSRVRIELNGEDAVIHRPHPRPEADKGSLVSMRRFLLQMGVKP